jgi:CelD/BcsL family acetyltransferase involved in cellulose biosynthesis
MAVFEIDPTKDSRWNSFIESHERSSIFHRSEWLQALHQTYGHSPIVFTTSPSELPLRNALVFCEVRSWLTGSKLVSLPFSDHCEPLVENVTELNELLSTIATKLDGRFKFAEIRPRILAPAAASKWTETGHFSFHALDLRPSIEELYSRLHKDGIQRKIRRSERERIVLARGRNDLIEEFYQLLLQTRRRHRLPPQPLSWFQNLVQLMGNRLTIHVARIDDRPIASILTLRHKNTLVYKYGCSDERFHSTGGMPRLFWHIIQEAKAEGLKELDLGRSDDDNPGLIRFKDHLGAARMAIRYWQFPQLSGRSARGLSDALHSRLVQRLILRLPDSLFRLAGEILYRHAG